MGQSANAACTINPGGAGGGGTGINYQAYNPALATYTVMPSAAVLAVPNTPSSGEILMRMTRNLPSWSGAAQGQATAYYGCVNGTIEYFNGNGGLVSGFSNVYATNMPGIGYRVAYYMPLGVPSQAVFAPTQYANPYTNGVMFYPMGGNSNFPGVLQAMIELVTTGQPITPGALNVGNIFGQVTVPGAPATQLYRVAMGGSLTFANPTCETVLPALTMTLPDVSTTTLIQDGVGPKTELVVQVTCAVPGTLSPDITIDTSNQVPGGANTLSNVSTAANKAEGVGIEVWLGSATPGGSYTPVTFGLEEANYGAPTGGSTPTDLWDFRIAANLKVLGPTTDLRAGPVQSTATLTFTYN